MGGIPQKRDHKEKHPPTTASKQRSRRVPTTQQIAVHPICRAGPVGNNPSGLTLFSGEQAPFLAAGPRLSWSHARVLMGFGGDTPSYGEGVTAWVRAAVPKGQAASNVTPPPHRGKGALICSKGLRLPVKQVPGTS